MLRITPLPILLLFAACGQSDEDRLQDAAEQSGPAAAQVLNQAAEDGVDPQVAIERAGEAQVRRDMETSSTLQARPNLPQDPNRPPAGEPPEKIDVASNSQDEHAGHDMGNSQ